MSHLPPWAQQRKASYIFRGLVYDELWPAIQQYVQTKCYGCRLQRLPVVQELDLDVGLHTCSTQSSHFWLERYTERFWEHLDMKTIVWKFLNQMEKDEEIEKRALIAFLKLNPEKWDPVYRSLLSAMMSDRQKTRK